MLFFFFLIIDLYFLIPEVIAQLCNFIAELVLPKEIPISYRIPSMLSEIWFPNLW